VAGHNSRVRLNTAYGNGYLDPPDDFGIGLVAVSNGNVIEDNVVAGNTNGIYIAATVGRNVVRDNTAVGNPAIQVSATRPEVRALDIVNLAPADQITFQRNKCVTAQNAPCPAIAPR
jgi:parallel beta-helix repeat protein